MVLPNFISNNLDQGPSSWVKDSESSLSFCSSEFIDFCIISVFLGAFSSTSIHIFLSWKIYASVWLSVPLYGLGTKELFLDSRALASKHLLSCSLAPDLQQVFAPVSICLACLSHVQQGLPHSRNLNCWPPSNRCLVMHQDALPIKIRIIKIRYQLRIRKGGNPSIIITITVTIIIIKLFVEYCIPFGNGIVPKSISELFLSWVWYL